MIQKLKIVDDFSYLKVAKEEKNTLARNYVSDLRIKWSRLVRSSDILIQVFQRPGSFVTL